MARFEVKLSEMHCKGCTFCVEACPKECLVMGEKLTSRGYRLPDFINEQACNGCGFCVIMCPDFAVTVFKLNEE